MTCDRDSGAPEQFRRNDSSAPEKCRRHYSSARSDLDGLAQAIAQGDVASIGILADLLEELGDARAAAVRAAGTAVITRRDSDRLAEVALRQRHANLADLVECYQKERRHLRCHRALAALGLERCRECPSPRHCRRADRLCEDCGCTGWRPARRNT